MEPAASQEDIKRAFRKEIARYHPDKVQHLGPEFQQIASLRAAELTEAYRVLMDPAARQKYDEALKRGGSVPPPKPAAAPQPFADPFRSQTPIPESFKQTRATLSEFVKKATVARFRDAAIAVCDATPIEVPGFDVAYACKVKRGIFKKAEPALRLLMRLVPVVDAGAITEAWPLALKASANDAMLCMMLMGQGLAPAKDLAAAVAEQRRKSRNSGPIVVPVDFRDWEALFPPDVPGMVRALVERLKQGDR